MALEIVEIIEVGPGWNKVRASDGNIYTLDGNYNWRSNNPGNIEYGPFAVGQGALGSGAVPPGRQRGFAIFPTYAAGQRAREVLQFESAGYKDLTIAEAIAKYAPSFENDVGAYVQAVTSAAGVSPDTKMSDLTPQQRAAFLAAQQEHEGWVEGDIFNADGVRLPPGEIPTVGTQLSVRTPASVTAQRTNRWFDRPTPAPRSQADLARANAALSNQAPTPAPRAQGTAARTKAALNRPKQAMLPPLAPPAGTGIIPRMDDIGSMPFFGELAKLAAGGGSRSDNSGVIRTDGFAGSVALPKGVRPDIPSTAGAVAPKPFPAPRPQTYAGQDGFVTKKVLNPAYTKALEERKKIPLGDVFHGLSRDAVAQRNAGLQTAAKLPAQWITVRMPVKPATPKPAAVPFSGRGAGSGGSSGSGSSPAPVPFSGTSTGKAYTPGQVYQTGDGRQLRANADGSFTNISSGKTSVGSSSGVTSPGGHKYDHTTGNWV